VLFEALVERADHVICSLKVQHVTVFGNVCCELCHAQSAANDTCRTILAS
jgi:hypothetical protein